VSRAVARLPLAYPAWLRRVAVPEQAHQRQVVGRDRDHAEPDQLVRALEVIDVPDEHAQVMLDGDTVKRHDIDLDRIRLAGKRHKRSRK
jgi:hypothetical protein